MVYLNRALFILFISALYFYILHCKNYKSLEVMEERKARQQTDLRMQKYDVHLSGEEESVTKSYLLRPQ